MQTEVILCTGKRGTGKTTWMREFIQDKTRVIVCEARFNEFGIKCVRSFEELVEEVRRGFFRVSYSPLELEWGSIFHLAMVSGQAHGPLWLVLEEAQRIPRHLPEYEVLNIQGRHYGINLIAASTRPSHLPPDYRSQATRVIAFMQHEPSDLKYLEEIIGEQAWSLPGLKRPMNGQPPEYLDWKEGDSYGNYPPESSSSVAGSPSLSTSRKNSLDKNGENEVEEEAGKGSVNSAPHADGRKG